MRAAEPMIPEPPAPRPHGWSAGSCRLALASGKLAIPAYLAPIFEDMSHHWLKS